MKNTLFVPMALAAGLMLSGLVQASDVQAGKAKYASCIACHGAQGAGTPMSPVPIAGRDSGEIAALLARYRAGETVGPQSALMFANVRGLSDEDIANLAAYIASM